MVILLEKPLKIEITRVSEPKKSLEYVTEKIERWAEKATRMYGIRHRGMTLTDPVQASSVLEGAEGLMFEQVRNFCIDDETVNIYYTCRETGGMINLLAVYGYTLKNYKGNW